MKISLRPLVNIIRESSFGIKIINYLGFLGWLLFLVVILFIIFTTYSNVYKVIIAAPDTGRVMKDVEQLKLKKEDFQRVKQKMNEKAERITAGTSKEFINPFARY